MFEPIIRLVKPALFLNKAVLWPAEIRQIHGKPFVSVSREDKPTQSLKNCTLLEAVTHLESEGFFAVPNNFDTYNIDHLKAIKHRLSPEWVETFNDWLAAGE